MASAKKSASRPSEITTRVRAAVGGGPVRPLPLDRKGSELATALNECQTSYPGTVRRSSLIQRFNTIPTGAFSLDYALFGGLPEGLATLFYGWEGSGKTTVAIGAVREAQRKYPGKMVLWVDAERTFDKDWAELHGVDLDRLYVVEPDHGQMAVDIVARFHEVEECCMIVVDSIPALVPQNILKKSASDQTMTELARLVGIMCSKSTAAWATQRKRRHYVTMILINQLRDKIGTLHGGDMQPGGHQLQFFITTRVRLTGREVLANELKKADQDKLGLAIAEDAKKDKSLSTPEFVEHTFKITKAKIGASMRQGEFRMNVNPQNALLRIGQYDDAKIAMLFAKRIGLLQGAAGAYFLLNISGDEVFRTYADMERWLCRNPDRLLLLRQVLIASLRISKQYQPIPDDGFLLAPINDRAFVQTAQQYVATAVTENPLEPETETEAGPPAAL